MVNFLLLPVRLLAVVISTAALITVALAWLPASLLESIFGSAKDEE